MSCTKYLYRELPPARTPPINFLFFRFFLTWKRCRAVSLTHTRQRNQTKSMGHFASTRNGCKHKRDFHGPNIIFNTNYNLIFFSPPLWVRSRDDLPISDAFSSNDHCMRARPHELVHFAAHSIVSSFDCDFQLWFRTKYILMMQKTCSYGIVTTARGANETKNRELVFLFLGNH